MSQIEALQPEAKVEVPEFVPSENYRTIEYSINADWVVLVDRDDIVHYMSFPNERGVDIKGDLSDLKGDKNFSFTYSTISFKKQFPQNNLASVVSDEAAIRYAVFKIKEALAKNENTSNVCIDLNTGACATRLLDKSVVLQNAKPNRISRRLIDFSKKLLIPFERRNSSFGEQ